MNKVVSILPFFLGFFSQAQVAIGKNTVTNPSVSLEFAQTENRGILLPYVTDNSNITVEGTVIYDTSDNKVKYFRDGRWFNLSIDDGTPDTIGNADLSLQGDEKAEYLSARSQIKSPATVDEADGILVLSDSNKAMILPRVAEPHLNIINPSAGIMVYDTVNKLLAIYNGKIWNFWKPE